MFNRDLYDLTQNLQGIIFQTGFAAYQKVLTPEEKAVQPALLMQFRRGYAESPAWFMVQAVEFDPEPLSVERLRVRAIWSAPGIVKALLELMMSENWLNRQGEDYYLTEMGRQILQRMAERTSRIVTSAELSMSSDQIEKLEQLLRRIVDSSLGSSDPPGSWCIRYSRRRAKANASAIERIVQYCSDLNAFRDDAHMSSWRNYSLGGIDWESFAFVTEEKAANANLLFEQLYYRGYAREDFQKALDHLVQRGWLICVDGQYFVTEQGRQIHVDAERLTDAYFYAPWSCLDQREKDELINLMEQVVKENHA